MNRKRLRIPFLIIVLLMMFVFGGGSGGVISNDELIGVIDEIHFLPVVSLDLIDGSTDTFISRNGLRWFVEGVEFSTWYREEYVLTINENRIHPDRLVIEEHLLTANITLDDGRNDVSLEAVDMRGRSLYYKATLWAGDNTVTVSLVNSDDEPFTTQTDVFASLADSPAITTRVVASNGIATLINIPDCAILINAKSVNNEFGSGGTVGSEKSVSITMRRFDTQVTVKSHDSIGGIENWLLPSSTSFYEPEMVQIEGLPSEAFGLVGGSSDTFISRNGLRWFLEGAEFSKRRQEEYVLTINGKLIPTDNLVIEEHLLTANITLDDGRNDVSLEAVDMKGRSLYYKAVLWAGDNIVTVSLVNSDGTPFTTQTEIIILEADFRTVTTRMVTLNGIGKFVNIPNCEIMIGAKSVNKDIRILSTSNIGWGKKITINMQRY